MFEILKSLEILRFFSTFILFLQKIPSNFQICKKKNGIYVLEKSLKNVCIKFQVIPFISVVFIAFGMWKMSTFPGHFGGDTMQFHIFILFLFIYNKWCSEVLFRVLDEKPTQKQVLRRQMDEIGNLTSWPHMTLTSEKVTSGKGRCLNMSQTWIMPIHRLLSAYAFILGILRRKGIKWKCQTF